MIQILFFTKPLKVGTTDTEVSQLQTFLSKDPSVYPEGTVSGWFGPATLRAVGRFQVKYGIARAGEAGYGSVGPATRAKLNSLIGTATPTTPAAQAPTSVKVTTTFTTPLTLGSTGVEVKFLQIILNTDSDTRITSEGAGSPGQETERFGGLTLVALKKFQVKYDIASEGTAGYGSVGPMTRAKLNELSK